jgi:Flp pilus assembly protein TadG
MRELGGYPMKLANGHPFIRNQSTSQRSKTMDTWKSRIGRLRGDSDGAVAILAALILLALLGAASLAIDMGQLYVVRNDLQNTADAAALAAAGSLITTQDGVVVRDATAAQQAALTVAQRQSQLAGFAHVDPGARNDLTITFGEWNLKAGDPETAWAEIGSTCGSNSNANAIRITLCRGIGTVYGPVSNLFASIFGADTSNLAATATAYLGFTNEVQTGTVQVPLALPSTILTAANGHSGWFARLFGPREAVASATKTLVIKDTGGAKVADDVPTSPTAALDPNQAYFYTVGSSDAVPATIKNILTKVYTPSYTASTPVLVADLKVGQQIYPRSEYPWGPNYIGPIFQNLQKAYNYKTTGNASTAPTAGTPWRVTLAVHGAKPLAFQLRKAGFLSLARLLAPFWPSEAYACSTMAPPAIVVQAFVNVDITGVTYTATCDDCSSYKPAKDGITYSSKKDCLTNSVKNAQSNGSVWNANTVTIQNVTDANTVSPPGSLSGGPSNQDIVSGAPANVGALATIARLVK